MARKWGFSKWSWRRASGLSAAKGRLSRLIGIPLTKSGRERKLGRLFGSLLWPLLFLGGGTKDAESEAQYEQDSISQTSPEPPQEGSIAGCAAVALMVSLVVVGLPALSCGILIALGNMASPPESPQARPTVASTQSKKKRSSERHTDVVVAVPSESPVLEPEPTETPPETEPVARAETVSPETAPPDEPSLPRRESRLWTSASGSFSVEATFIRYSNGKAHLRKVDGHEIEVDETKLSRADRDYIEHLRANILPRR